MNFLIDQVVFIITLKRKNLSNLCVSSSFFGEYVIGSLSPCVPCLVQNSYNLIMNLAQTWIQWAVCDTQIRVRNNAILTYMCRQFSSVSLYYLIKLLKKAGQSNFTIMY